MFHITTISRHSELSGCVTKSLVANLNIALSTLWILRICHSLTPHLNVWGATMACFSVFVLLIFSHSKQLKGPDTATLYKPPSHHLFNALNNNQVGQVSALLERCVRSNTQLVPPLAAPTMNFNLNIPAEVATLLCPHAPPPAANTPVSTAHDPGSVLRPLPVISNTMLVSSDRLPGPELSLADFCSKYGLTTGISQKLDENG